MNEQLRLSKQGADLIQGFESCQLTAYKDVVRPDGTVQWAIGWGHSGLLGNPEVHEGMTITKEKADEIFLNDAKIFENKVRSCVTVTLNQNQFDALVCFAYNVSTAHLKEMIELSRLNEGHYDSVPEALMKYNVSRGRVLRGLTRRRQLEGQLFSRK